MEHIRFNHPDDGDAIATLAGTYFYPGCVSIARIRDGVCLGGVLFSNYTEESIQMHTASWTPHWINRDLLYVGFDYPFNQLQVKRIFGQVPEDNFRAQKFNENAGFRVVARVEGVFAHNIACLVMRLDREECRFLRVRPRTIISNAA